MKSRSLILLLTVLFNGLMLGCIDEKQPELLSEDQLVALVADVHLAEGALQNVGVSELDSITDLYYQQIFEIHGISEEEFVKNLDYLKKHPNYAEKIYERIVEDYTNIKLE